WYQPKINLWTNRIAGAQGVIVLCHPQHGLRRIDNLLTEATADTRATITQRFVISALRDWDEAEFNLRLCVNVTFSALAALDITALDRDHRPKALNWPGLILGVSEHEVIDDLEFAHEIATQLRIHDITLAINNFGAGSSSLERLRELPFSEVNL